MLNRAIELKINKITGHAMRDKFINPDHILRYEISSSSSDSNFSYFYDDYFYCNVGCGVDFLKMLEFMLLSSVLDR